LFIIAASTWLDSLSLPDALPILPTIEALFSGTPVLGTRRGALPEIVTPAVGVLRDTLDELIAAGDQVTTLDPRACRERAERQFRSEEHTSELQSRVDLVCRLLLE